MDTELIRTTVKNAAAKRRFQVFGIIEKPVFEDYETKTTDRGCSQRKRPIQIDRQTPDLTPSDIDKIKTIYNQAKTMSAETGVEHHVDHICPIAKGGAHHWLNMSVITAKENLSKGSKWNGVDGYAYEQLI